jgi:hypothetical protein
MSREPGVEYGVLAEMWERVEKAGLEPSWGWTTLGMLRRRFWSHGMSDGLKALIDGDLPDETLIELRRPEEVE